MKEKFKKAVEAGNITYADSEEIEEYYLQAEDFLAGLLGLKHWFISNESSLHDFATCGLPDDIEADSLKAAYAAWDEWVIEKIQQRYSIKLEDTNILLLDLFKKIHNGPLRV